MQIKTGLGRGLRRVVGAGPHGYWIGSYERCVQERLTNLLKPGDHFVELAANSGFYSLLASHLVGTAGRVTSFEPLPRDLEFLRKHIELNQLPSVTVVGDAVSDKNGTARSKPTDMLPLGTSPNPAQSKSVS